MKHLSNENGQVNEILFTSLKFLKFKVYDDLVTNNIRYLFENVDKELFFIGYVRIEYSTYSPESYKRYPHVYNILKIFELFCQNVFESMLNRQKKMDVTFEFSATISESKNYKN